VPTRASPRVRKCVEPIRGFSVRTHARRFVVAASLLWVSGQAADVIVETFGQQADLASLSSLNEAFMLAPSQIRCFNIGDQRVSHPRPKPEVAKCAAKRTVNCASRPEADIAPPKADVVYRGVILRDNV
jgi:hypothetical protein